MITYYLLISISSWLEDILLQFNREYIFVPITILGLLWDAGFWLKAPKWLHPHRKDPDQG